MEPLIVSPSAARRLKTLLGHGVQLSERLLSTLPSTVTDGLLKPQVALLLQADVLPNPLALAADEDLDDLGRDILVEVAVSAETLETLNIPSGSLIEIRNPDRTDIPAHLARVWTSDDAPKRTVLLAPTLAHNLGLGLHLWPLLKDTNEDDSQDDREERVSTGCCSKVKIKPYSAQRADSKTSSPIGNGALDRQPLVPIAAEVQLAMVREPSTDRLGLSTSSSSRNNQALDSHNHRQEKSRGAGAFGGGTNEDTFLSVAQHEFEQQRKQNDADKEVVDAIQSYFMRGLRVVSAGDVLAVRLQSATTSAGELLSNLRVDIINDTSNNTQNNLDYSFRVMYFKVQSVSPSSAPFLAVDVTSTVVKLAGTCCAALPVGLRGYLHNRRSDAVVPKSLVGWHPAAATLSSGWNLPFVGTLMPTWRQVAQILAPALHPGALGTASRLRLSILLHAPSGSGKRTAASAAAAALGCHPVWLSARDICGESTPDSKAAEALRAAFEAAGRYRPAMLVINDIQHLASAGSGGGAQPDGAAAARLGTVLAECIASGFAATAAATGEDGQRAVTLAPAPVILIGCAPTTESLPASLRRCFTHEVAVEAPDRQTREQLLRGFLQNGNNGGGGGGGLRDQDWADLARHTAGLLPRDLRTLVADACAAASLTTLPPETMLALSLGRTPPPPSSYSNRNATIAAPPIELSHVSEALEATRERTAADIGAPKIPSVRWEDVGGLEDVKAAVLDTVELPLRHPELFAGGLRRRSGVLLYGPPGTGKTLLAKAVATECSVNFLSVKGPELINMYVGESERLVRDVFARARRARPCVIFFDELDSLAPARGRGSDSGGVMDRVVSQLLAEIDSAQSGSGTDDVFVIGATNRPDLLDPALLRPGRLDKLLYVGVAGDAAAQLEVIRALTRKFALTTDVDLTEVAEKCPRRLTGADLYALCSDAWMTALKRKVKQLESNDDGSGDDSNVVVEQQDFLEALRCLRPSLSEDEVARYEAQAIRDQYQGNTKKR